MGYRRYQRGSVMKRGNKGQQTWYGMWREDVPNPDGGFARRQRKVKLGPVSELPNRSMALAKLAVLMNQKPSTRLAFSELFERWKAAVVPTLKESTANNYVYNLKQYVVPTFGNREVSALGRYDVETFLADKAKMMYCRNTLRGMRASLGRLLSWAVACNWIEKNPCAGVRLPIAGSKVKRTILTPQQVIALAARLEEPYSTLILFLAATGLRIGEAVGIKWTDFEGDILHLQRRIYERREGTMKTRGSERSVPIPSLLLERMRTLGDGEWVFRSQAGTPVDPKNAANRYVRPAAKELGISLGGWHDFRHTLSTQLLKRYPTKVVSELLGHSDVRTTLAIYQHVETENFRAPMNEMTNELLPDVTKSGSKAA
jgi:integrase